MFVDDAVGSGDRNCLLGPGLDINAVGLRVSTVSEGEVLSVIEPVVGIKVSNMSRSSVGDSVGVTKTGADVVWEGTSEGEILFKLMKDTVGPIDGVIDSLSKSAGPRLGLVVSRELGASVVGALDGIPWMLPELVGKLVDSCVGNHVKACKTLGAWLSNPLSPDGA